MPSVEQESNLEFLLESVTIMGGLMVLLSSERQNRKAKQRKEQPSQMIDPGETAEEANKMNLLQLCGRARLMSPAAPPPSPAAPPPSPAASAAQVRPHLHLGGLPLLRRQDDARARPG